MKRMLISAAAIALVASAAVQAQGYYATKADERAGRLTPGAPPALMAGSGLKVGTNACPGLTIPDPGAATYTDTGTTVGADNTVTSVQAGCSSYTTTAGPDVVYQFDLGPVAARGTPLTITATPTLLTEAAYDISIYTLSTAGAGCPAGTGNAVTNCVNGNDASVSPGAEVITDIETDAMVPGHYFLFIDSFYTALSACSFNPSAPCHQGSYSLAFGTGPLPVELLDFTID